MLAPLPQVITMIQYRQNGGVKKGVDIMLTFMPDVKPSASVLAGSVVLS